MSKAFGTIHIHTLIRKLLQTNIPDTIIKFITNYIKGCKAYTTYRNHTSRQRQFKTGVLSPTLFNIYTSDLPPPSAPVQVMAYADDITITSIHTSTGAAKTYIQSYLHKVMQNAALKTATGCTQDTNIQHLHDEHSYFPYTSTNSSTPHNSNRKHNIHHIPYTNILQHSHSHYNRHKNKHAPYTHIYCLFASSHKRQ